MNDKKFQDKNLYILEVSKIVLVEVEANSPHSAAELVPNGCSLVSVRPKYGRDEEKLTPVDNCFFCDRPLLCDADGPLGERWSEVPREMIPGDMFLPFGTDVACPNCARAKGIVSE